MFVPMVLLSSLHVHTTADTGAAECVECVHHLCHGHLVQLDTAMHACVLCQFVTLSYVAAAVTAVVLLINNVCQQTAGHNVGTVSTLAPGVNVTRGPPAMGGA